MRALTEDELLYGTRFRRRSRALREAGCRTVNPVQLPYVPVNVCRCGTRILASTGRSVCRFCERRAS